MDPSVDDDFIPDEPDFIPDEKPKTPTWISASRGGLQGATGGFADEGGGALQAFLQYHVNSLPSAWRGPLGLPSEDQDPLQVYRDARDADRRRDATARADHPFAYGGGEVAGALATAALIPGEGVAPGANALARAGSAAARAIPMGATSGLGHSDAATVPQAAADTAMGALTAAGTAGALNLAGSGYQAVRGAVGGAESRASQAIAEEAAKVKEAEIASARGALGGEVQAGSRQVENLDRMAPKLPTWQRGQVAALEPEAQALRQRVAAANLRDLPGQVPLINARQAQLDKLLAEQGPATDKLAEEMRKQAPGAVLSTLTPDKATLGRKAAGAVGAAGGGLLGSVLGVGGAHVGAHMGREAAEALAGAASSPQGRFALAQWAGKALDAGAIPGAYAARMAEALSRGPAALAVLHVQLAKSDPQYLPALQRAAETAR